MTAQIHEKLILNGKRMSLACEPDIPTHERILKLSDADNENSFDVIFSTACWRQYVGTWEIKNGKFYLIDIKGIYKLVGKEPLFADWFSGELRIPEGEIIEYKHAGYGSKYERELFIMVEKGLVVSQYEKSNEISDKSHAFDVSFIRMLFRKQK